jgi:hypothetical protein
MPTLDNLKRKCYKGEILDSPSPAFLVVPAARTDVIKVI